MTPPPSPIVFLYMVLTDIDMYDILALIFNTYFVSVLYSNLCCQSVKENVFIFSNNFMHALYLVDKVNHML